MHKHIKKMAIELHKSEHTKNRIFFCKQLQLEREAECKERASEKNGNEKGVQRQEYQCATISNAVQNEK